MNAKHTSRYNLSIKQCSRPNVAPPDLQTFNLPLLGWLCTPSDPLYIEILSLQYSTVQYFETSCSSYRELLYPRCGPARGHRPPGCCHPGPFSLSSSLELTAQGVLEFVQEGLLHLAINYLEKRRACGLRLERPSWAPQQQLINCQLKR
jgi:hypothetical protein